MSCCGPITLTFALVLAVRAGTAEFDAATAINLVGFDLYRQLAAAEPTRNLALSPYSIESALALAYAGADGETREEMARALHFPADDQPLQAAWFRAHAHLGPPRLISLHLPKFRMEGATIDLSQNVESLGMQTAFDQPRGSANFNRAAPRRPNDYLYMSKVFHQAFIAVDEEGTEAAAGMVVDLNVTLGVEMNPPEPLAVHVDHPFCFAVQDRASGSCLFFGSVVDPPSPVNP